MTDALRQRATSADADATAAREELTSAQRVLDSVGADGLLPASLLAEQAARRCQAAELPAWPGWRWLADTLPSEAAAVFARARPEIASGVVVAHPDVVDDAVAAITGLDLDAALWVGAVTDTEAARSAPGDGAGGGAVAAVLLPHPGAFDRQAAHDMLAVAADARDRANERQQAATRRATNARDMLAALAQLWVDFPDDPRPELQQQIDAAHGRREAAEAAEAAALETLEDLQRQQGDAERDRDTAQELIDTHAETRRLLVPVIAAATAFAEAHAQLPGLRATVIETRQLSKQLIRDMPNLVAETAAAEQQVRDHTRDKENAAEALRQAGLSPTIEGLVPTDDEATIRARLDSVRAALAQAAVDPHLHEEIRTRRQRLSDLNARLEADRDVRQHAERLAATDGARHPVALDASIRAAERHEAQARERYAVAEAAAKTAIAEHKRRMADRSADRSSPDAEGFPPSHTVTIPDDADRYAEQLDDLANGLLTAQRAEEQLARTAEQTAQTAQVSQQLVEASATPLRHLADPTLTGRPAAAVEELTRRITAIADRLRKCAKDLADSERTQQDAASTVRAHANGPHARKVEEADDPRVVDLIMRLRADKQLPAEAERIASHLEQRATSLQDDLDRHERNVRTCATMLHVQAATAIGRLRAYQNQSQLPDGLGDWSQRRFVLIDHEPVPDDESVAVDRVARVVHNLLTPGASRSDAPSLLFAAARALVDSPFRVRLLKPHIDLSLDRVDVAELRDFSGGQRVTAGVLLYATMTRVRGSGDAPSIGWLWLDNPFGQASADQFVRTMRRAADQLGLQLLFTAAPKDKGALSMFDRTIMLARRSRPSSKEKVVVIDDGSRDIVDLVLIQKDVAAVLGG